MKNNVTIITVNALTVLMFVFTALWFVQSLSNPMGAIEDNSLMIVLIVWLHVLDRKIR